MQIVEKVLMNMCSFSMKFTSLAFSSEAFTELLYLEMTGLDTMWHGDMASMSCAVSGEGDERLRTSLAACKWRASSQVGRGKWNVNGF